MSVHIDNPLPQTPPQTPPQIPPQPPAPRTIDGRVIAAIALIAIGMLALIGTFTSSRIFGLSFLPMLGLIFVAWGLAAQIPGLLVPGGILTGLGAGVAAADLLFTSAESTMRAGIIVLGMALGFAVIAPLARLIAHGTQWWALVVGGIMALIGAALMIGGPAMDALTVVGRFWPVVFIVFGAYLIWQVMRKR